MGNIFFSSSSEQQGTGDRDSHRPIGKITESQVEKKGVEDSNGLNHNISDIQSFAKILQSKFSIGDHLADKLPKPSCRIVVIGMGGGCDIFSAYAVCLSLSKRFGQDHDILYANTKSISFLKSDVDGHEKLTEDLYKVPPKQIILDKGCDRNCYGTSKLTQSLPRHSNGSPYILVLPTESKDPVTATKENEAAMKKAFEILKTDFIIGVDTGGDSITGGLDWNGSVELGRDFQMQNAIVKSGVPNLILAFGPGSDGESSVKIMNESVTRMEKQGCFLGAFSLKNLLIGVRPWTENLSPMRTPNICYSAAMGQTPEEMVSRTVEGVEYLKLIRYCSTQWIPRTWLRHGLAFDLSTSVENGDHK